MEHGVGGADLQSEWLGVGIDHGEVRGGRREGVAGEGDYMIRRGGVHVALQMKPHVMAGGSRGGGSIHAVIIAAV